MSCFFFFWVTQDNWLISQCILSWQPSPVAQQRHRRLKPVERKTNWPTDAFRKTMVLRVCWRTQIILQPQATKLMCRLDGGDSASPIGNFDQNTQSRCFPLAVKLESWHYWLRRSRKAINAWTHRGWGSGALRLRSPLSYMQMFKHRHFPACKVFILSD